MADENHARRRSSPPYELSPSPYSGQTPNSTQPTNALPTNPEVHDPNTGDHSIQPNIPGPHPNDTTMDSNISFDLIDGLLMAPNQLGVHEGHGQPNVETGRKPKPSKVKATKKPTKKLRHVDVEHTPENEARIEALSKSDQLIIRFDSGNTEAAQLRVLAAVEALPADQHNTRLSWTRIPSTSNKGERFRCKQGDCTHKASTHQRARQHYVAAHVPDTKWECPKPGCLFFKRLDDLKRHIAKVHDTNYHRRVRGDPGLESISGTDVQLLQPAMMSPHQSTPGAGPSQSNRSRGSNPSHQETQHFGSILHEQTTARGGVRRRVTRVNHARRNANPYPRRAQQGMSLEVVVDEDSMQSNEQGLHDRLHPMWPPHPTPPIPSQTGYLETSRDDNRPLHYQIDELQNGPNGDLGPLGDLNAHHIAQEQLVRNLAQVPRSTMPFNQSPMAAPGLEFPGTGMTYRIPVEDRARGDMVAGSHSRLLRSLPGMLSPSMLFDPSMDDRESMLHGHPMVSTSSPLVPFQGGDGSPHLLRHGYSPLGWTTSNQQPVAEQGLAGPSRPTHDQFGLGLPGWNRLTVIPDQRGTAEHMRDRNGEPGVDPPSPRGDNGVTGYYDAGTVSDPLRHFTLLQDPPPRSYGSIHPPHWPHPSTSIQHCPPSDGQYQPEPEHPTYYSETEGEASQWQREM